MIAAEAANARLIVTNHHKLALLNRDEFLGGLFVNYVIDEANHFEQAVRGAFGLEISSRDVADVLTYIESVLGRRPPGPGALPGGNADEALQAVQDLREHMAALMHALSALRAGAAPGESTVLPGEHPAFEKGRLKANLDALRKALKRIVGALPIAGEGEGRRIPGLHPRTAERMKTALKDLKDHGRPSRPSERGPVPPGMSRRAPSTSALDPVPPVGGGGRSSERPYLRRQGLRRFHLGHAPQWRRIRRFQARRRDAVARENADPDSARTAHEEEGIPAPTPGREFRFEAVSSPFDPDALEIAVHPKA